MKGLFDFELSVYDLIVINECDTSAKLEKLANALHEAVENAILNYCYDEKIEDYEPSY
jgi:hypothetical protein